MGSAAQTPTEAGAAAPLPAAAAAATTPAEAGGSVEAALQQGWRAEVDQHMIQRSKSLKQQLRRWWHKIGGAVTSSGAEGNGMLQ
jgi:hypothetical protein